MTTEQPSAATSAAPTRPYRILVAVAFESTADAALHEAMRLAIKNADSELHVVHVVSGPPASDGLTFEVLPKPREDIIDLLRTRIDAAWEEAGSIQVIAHIRAGDAAGSVLRVAVDVDADVIVVGSSRRSGLRKLMLGSVAEQVLHGSHCPVLIAVPKDYSSTASLSQIEPACEDCLRTRKESANARFWCERHSKPYLEPHVYVPRDSARSSVFPTY